MSRTPRPTRSPRARTTLARMAVNATLAGAWATALLALLFFYLNADVSLTLRNYLPLALPLILFYAPASGLVWALLAGAVRLFAAFRVRVPWLGFRPFWRFLVADLVVLALLYVASLGQARDYLPAAMALHLQGATVLLGIGALALALDTLRRGLGRRRLRPLAAVAAAVLLTAGLFGIRERYRPVEPTRSASEFEPPVPAAGVLLLGLDGAAPDDLLPMVADGRLPEFRRLLEEGSSAPLDSPRPARPVAAWTSIRTGLLPAEHGVVGQDAISPPGGAPVFRLAPGGMLLEGPLALGLLRRAALPAGPTDPTLELILARCGYRVVQVGWPDQPPPPPVDPAFAWPEAVNARLQAIAGHIDRARRDADGAALAQVLAESLGEDLAVAAFLERALEEGETPAVAVVARFGGLQKVARSFLRYQRPDRFGNVTAAELERYGAVLPDYYRLLDAWLGVLRRSLGAQAVVVMASPYGMAPVGPFTRVRNAVSGRSQHTGTERRSGPGMLLAAGPGVRAGGRLERARAVDVLPTLLYLLDLPVGRDMDGQPLPRFASDEYADRHAVSAVPSWRTVSVVREAHLW